MRARWFLLAALLPSSLAAQRPQTREGFWFSFGVGQGNLRWECDGCGTQDHGGPTGFLRVGGTLSQKVLLSGELNMWSLDIGAFNVTAVTATFTVNWYPSATSGWFLKGGLGGGSYDREGGAAATSQSAALILGTGYDIRIGPMISITPMLTAWTTGNAELKNASTTLNTGFRHSGGTIQVGITFH